MTNKMILGAEGFDGIHPLNQKEIETCEKWITQYTQPIKAINKKQGSYNLKEIVEKNHAVYISNGAFIQAAINLGYRYQKSHRSEKNVFFNMQFKD